MAFKFKDLMVSVGPRGGVDEPVCTLDTMKPAGAPAPRGITCTVDTMDPAGQAITCTVDTMDPAGQAHTCTVDTMGIRRAGTGQGVCTLDTMFPAGFGGGMAGMAALTTVTTVTTVTTLVQAVSPGAASLAQLKAQLQQALADKQPEPLPGTVEEAEDLERRLEGALEELRDHRRALEKGGKKTGAKPARPRK